ncbi:MAG: helix-turn-helix domain-containing protein [Bacteroidota bacterium]
MNLRSVTYNPGFPLNQFIDLVWVSSSDTLEMSSTHHAALFTELIFNYGEQFQMTGENIENSVAKNCHYIVSGLKTSPFKTEVSGRHLNVGLFLKPHCYGLLREGLSGRKMGELSDLIYQELIDAKKPSFAKIEIPLFEFFKGLTIDDDLQKFSSLLTQLEKRGALKKFSDTLSITQKSFIQKFKRHYAITPGEFLKLNRVNHAAQLIANTQAISLTQVGMMSGFYDQSHFIKTFKRHFGQTPRQFKNTITS